MLKNKLIEGPEVCWSIEPYEGVQENLEKASRVLIFSDYLQEEPDTPEALACVPSLQLSDIPKESEKVPTSLRDFNGAQLMTHDLFTNNVVYLEAALNLKPVPTHLLPLLPLFCK